MRTLSDEELVEAYLEAKKLGLEPNFIEQLESAIKQRNININKDNEQK